MSYEIRWDSDFIMTIMTIMTNSCGGGNKFATRSVTCKDNNEFSVFLLFYLRVIANVYTAKQT